MLHTSGGFAPDACIRTNLGDRPMHALACGDLVLTPSGEAIAVREVIQVPTRDQVRLSIPAKAFVKGPSKPLRIARHKAVCVRIIDDVLVELDALAGNSTIERVHDERDFFDLVLERPAIVLADDLPMESCGDVGRGALGPAVCSELVLGAVRDHLLMRAGLVGWWLDHAPPLDLHLVADGERLTPSIVGGAHRFLVSAETVDLQMRCNAGVPAHVVGSGDRRELGACVAAITVGDGFGVQRSINLEHPKLDRGFHGFEGSHRWSRRIAPLAAEFWAGCSISFFIRIDVLAPAVARYRPPSEREKEWAS